MNAKQRAQVVELLRCAADLAICGDRYGALGTASFETGILMPGSPIGDFSYWYDVLRFVVPDGERETYEFRLLEAAARVEAGEWP